MALTPIAMDFGNGVFMTDVDIADYSFAKATINTDTRWRGPDFSMGCRVKKNDLITNATVIMGVLSSTLGGRRFSFTLQAFADTTNLFTTTLRLTTPTFLDITDVVSYDVAEDLLEHSVAVTYETGGLGCIYWDGLLVASASAPAEDISIPASAGDLFGIQAGNASDGLTWYVDNCWYTNQVATALHVLNIHNNGLAGYVP